MLDDLTNEGRRRNTFSLHNFQLGWQKS